MKFSHVRYRSDVGRMLRSVVVVASLLVFAQASAIAATYSVTKTADTNDGTCNADCSLREAIVRANQTGAADTIVFDPIFGVAQTISLSLGGLPSITNPLVITGPGARLLTIDGLDNAGQSVFSVSAGTNVSISGVTITRGNAGEGGGIRNAGSLIISEVRLNRNSAEFGGGIYSSGSLTVINSLIDSNSTDVSADPAGGGIYIAVGPANIANSSVINNSAFNVLTMSGRGGGIDVGLAGALTLNNVTVANNVAFRFGGGIELSGSGGAAALRNTIVAGNVTQTSTDVDLSSTVISPFVSNGNNLIGNPNGANGLVNGVNGDIVGVSPGFGVFTNNGGPTNTLSILPTSPARNAGNNCVTTATCGSGNPPAALTTDQRSSGFLRLSGSNVDIGAYELMAPTAAGVTIKGRVLNAYGRAIASARLTLSGGDTATPKIAYTNTFGYYQLSEVPAGQTYVLSVDSRRYAFEESTRLIDVFDSIDGENFVASR